MIEAVRTGKPVSIVEYQELTENDPQLLYLINEAKKAWKREQPKVYRNNTGKRTKFIKKLYEEECDIQSLAEENGETNTDEGLPE